MKTITGNIFKGRSRAIKVITAIFIIFLFMIFSLQNSEFTSILSKIKIKFIPLLLVISATNLLLNGLRIKYMMLIFKIKLSFKEYFSLGLATSIGNYFLPLRGGASIRAVYLKKRYDFQYPVFLSTLLASYIIVFMIYGGVGVFTSILNYIAYDRWNTHIFLIFCLFILSPRIVLFRKLTGRVSIFKKVIQGWDKIRKNSFFKSLIILELIIVIVNILLIKFSFMSLGIEVDIISATLISLISLISMFINLVPASIGLKEMMITSSAYLLGIGLNEGLASSILIRLIEVLSLIFCSIFIVSVSEDKIFKKKKDDIEKDV